MPSMGKQGWMWRSIISSGKAARPLRVRPTRPSASTRIRVDQMRRASLVTSPCQTKSASSGGGTPVKAHDHVSSPCVNARAIRRSVRRSEFRCPVRCGPSDRARDVSDRTVVLPARRPRLCVRPLAQVGADEHFAERRADLGPAFLGRGRSAGGDEIAARRRGPRATTSDPRPRCEVTGLVSAAQDNVIVG